MDTFNEIERLALVMAQKGADHVDRLLRILTRARAMIDDPAFARRLAAAAAAPALYAWEADEGLAPDMPLQLLAGTCFDGATGEGLTMHMLVTRARSEAEYRRLLAARVGRHLADTADVFGPLDRTTALRARSISNALDGWMKAVAAGSDRPGAASYFASYHANYW